MRSPARGVTHSISVVIPAYNDPEALASSLESLLLVPVPNHGTVELIVSDDGSTDGTAQLARKFASTDSRVRVLDSENAGPGAARNRGVTASSGDFVMFLDSGDVIRSNLLSSIVNAFDETGVGFVTWPARVHDRLVGACEVWEPDRYGPQGVLSLAGCFATQRWLLESIGGYDEALRFGENTDLCQRLLDECARLGLSTKRLNDIGVEITLTTSSAEFDRRRLDAAEHLLERDAESLRGDGVRRSNLHSIATVNAVRCNEWGPARWHAAAAWRARPFDPKVAARIAIVALPPLARRMWASQATRPRF